jgi:hypothetical protein
LGIWGLTSSQPAVALIAGSIGCGAHKFVRTVDWPFPTSRKPLALDDRSVPTPVENRWQPLDASPIHAAAGNGAREYSRRSPPSLSSHVTGPEVTTGSERAIGVCRSSPRWGRAWL